MPYCEPSFSFDPVIFAIPTPWDFELPIRWYAMAYIAGLLLGWRYMVSLSRRPGLWNPAGTKNPKAPFNGEQVDDLLIWATLGVIVGGRLGYVIFYMPDMIWERPQDIILGITQGGMAFHGGLIGVSLALWVFARRQELDLWRIADAAAVVTPIGLFFGRIANFINGELWGRPTDLPWGMRFRSLERPGLNAGLFLLSYGLFRAILETVREPDLHMPEALRGYVTMGMLLSIPMIIAGAWLVRRALNAQPAKV